MYQVVLADATFHEQLLVFDRNFAASARAARCWLCGGVLHSASYDRKPRGGPPGLGQAYAERFSFCCAADGCRKRTTPPPVRFLGHKVYLATVVTLISAIAAWHDARTPGTPVDGTGIDRRTLALACMVAFDLRRRLVPADRRGCFFMPPLDIAGLPASLLQYLPNA